MTLKIGLVQQAAITVGGPTQTFTDVNLDGETPKGAFFMVTKALTPLVAADHAALSFGAADASNQWAASIQVPARTRAEYRSSTRAWALVVMPITTPCMAKARTGEHSARRCPGAGGTQGPVPAAP